MTHEDVFKAVELIARRKATQDVLKAACNLGARCQFYVVNEGKNPPTHEIPLDFDEANRILSARITAIDEELAKFNIWPPSLQVEVPS